MKKRSVKTGIILSLMLLAIGFAAVATNLMINGNILVGTNEDDFDVIFTKSIINSVDKSVETISDDGKTITFQTKNLSKIGDKSVLDFEVTNNSSQYDATVSMNCSTNGSKTEYYTITNTIPDTIAAQTREKGKVEVTLNKVTTETITETFTCTLDVNAVERTETAKPLKACKATEGDGSQVGDKITCGSESFYVIKNDGINIRMLAEYNLEVGGIYDTSWVAIENPSGLQNSEMIGFTSSRPYKGVTKYSDTSSDYAGSIVEGYVNEYKTKLEDMGVNVKEATLITKEELDELGCDSSSYTCKNAPAYVYQTTYWTRSAHGTGKVWFVHSQGTFGNYSISYDGNLGVRPVISILSSDI